MGSETEIKLSLSTRSANKLASHPLLAGVERQRVTLVNTYYDTPDKRLRHERLGVRHRRQGSEWLLTVKKSAMSGGGGIARRSEWEVPGKPGEFDFAHVDDPAVRALLESLRDQLQPIFTTRFRRHLWLLEPRAGVRVELALDRGWVEAQGQRRTICEVELELLAGGVGELFVLASALQAGLPLHPESSSKSDRAYRLLDLPRSPPAPPALEPAMPCLAAFRLLAMSCVNHLQKNEKGACANDSPEFAQRAARAIRRLRSAIRLWEALLPEAFGERFDPRWRELAAPFDEAQACEVFLATTLPLLGAHLPGAAELERLAQHARRRLAQRRKAVRRELKSAAYSRLLIDFTATLLDLPEDGSGLLGSFVAPGLEKCAARVEQLAAEFPEGDRGLRRLARAVNRLCDALDFFQPLAAGAGRASWAQSTARLQEILAQLSELAFAGQLVRAALSRKRGQTVDAWLAARRDSLLPRLAQLLEEFREQAAPRTTVRSCAAAQAMG